MVGVAVGLGNVWRFPYMMGSYGGSAFLVIYLLFTIMFAFPALITEMAIGKRIRTGTVDAYRSLFGNSWGGFIGYLLVIVVTIAGSYYAVVVANVWFSAGFSIVKGYSVSTNGFYQTLLGNTGLQYLITVLLIIASLIVSGKGLKKGIERISMIVMPFFVLAILYMIGYSWMLPGAIDKVGEFLSPDFGAIGSTEVFAALGQAFFSVGLGGTFVIVYSGFLSKEQSVKPLAIFTGLGDLGSSVLVSLFLVPCMLVFGIRMNAGPSLIFNTLPELFAVIPGGRLIGSLFMIALSLVAFLSLIAAFQVPLSSLKLKGIRPERLILLFGLLQIVLTFPSAFFPQIIGILDLIFGSGMQVLGSVLAITGVWWGAGRSTYRESLFSDQSSRVAGLSMIWFRFVIPVTLLAVLIGYLYDSFN